MIALRTRVGPKSVSSLLKQISLHPHTLAELHTTTGLGTRPIGIIISALRKTGVVFIANWQADSRGYHTIAGFAWGPGQLDVPKPTKTAVQRNRAWRERQAQRSLTTKD